MPTFHNFHVVDEQRFLQTLNPQSYVCIVFSLLWECIERTNICFFCSLQNVASARSIIECCIDVYHSAKHWNWCQRQNYIYIAIVECWKSSGHSNRNIASNTRTGENLNVKKSINFTKKKQKKKSFNFIFEQDRRPPIIWWNYGSRCDGRLGSGQCAGAIWSLEITTADYDTGILRVHSNPRGLIVRNVFTAGTRDEVKATYSASCCTPRVTITSYDLAGNQRTISVDVTEYILGPVEIAAIVLGCILILIILAVIIAIIVYCCKKRKEVRELPVYRSRTERERERAT